MRITATVTVSYTAPTSTPIQDPTGNDAANLVDEAVANNTPDTTAPRVTSIERQTPSSSPTNADTLTWRVTFSEDVQNVDTGDFSLTGTTATVTAVTAVAGSESQYDVTASGGNLANLNDTVTLSFATVQSITDKASTPNALSNTAPTGTNESDYVVDNTVPTVGSAIINGASLVITFSEDLLTTSSLANSAFTVEKDVGGTATDANPHRHALDQRQDRDPDPGHRGEPHRHRHHGELQPAVLGQQPDPGCGRQPGRKLHRPGRDQQHPRHHRAAGDLDRA